MIGSTAAVERGPSQGARSGSKEPTWVPFLPFCFRRRPIQFSVPAAVETKKKGQVLQSNNRFAILPSHGPSAAY